MKNNEPGILYRDMFQLEEIPGNYQGVDIHIIRPDVDPQEFGVNFTDATPEGLSALINMEKKLESGLGRYWEVDADASGSNFCSHINAKI